jgi:hypothetical protein
MVRCPHSEGLCLCLKIVELRQDRELKNKLPPLAKAMLRFSIRWTLPGESFKTLPHEFIVCLPERSRAGC